MKILGIETSCDETAAAVVESGRRILSNTVVSQIDIFKEYGGVIPEVAARSHLEVVLPVIDKALADARCGWGEIDAIAVTHAPGLLGSLLIGTLTARTLAILHEKPLYAVHHLKSHVYANWLAGEDLPEFPLIAMVVSGGHTQILYMPGHNQFEIIGTTRDDAVGECFDKVAKILGLPYPGGPSIAKAALGELPREVWDRVVAKSTGQLYGGASDDTKKAESDEISVADGDSEEADVKERPSGDNIRKAAATDEKIRAGDPKKYKLPKPNVSGLDFSFSGLKTAVLRAVQKELGLPISHPSHDLKNHLTAEQIVDFAAAFQETACEILLDRLKKAVLAHPEVRSVVFAGGVSANQVLREKALAVDFRASLEAAGGYSHKIGLYFPAPQLSGDNGAMVAAAGYYEIISGIEPADPYKLNIYPRISIES